MSADLLEAFGTQVIPTHELSRVNSTSVKPKQSNTSLSHPDATIAQGRVPAVARDSLWKKDISGTDILFDASADEVVNKDDFGDFQDPEATAQLPQNPLSTAPDLNNTDLLGFEPVTSISGGGGATPPSVKVSHASIDDPFESILDFGNVATTTVMGTASSSQNIESEDDWGTFEDAEPETVCPGVITITSSKLSRTLQPWPEVADEDDWEVFDNEPVAEDVHMPSTNVSQQLQALLEDTDEEDWDAFEDGPAPAPSTLNHTSKPQPTSMSIPTPPTTHSKSQRPTNIPPPSILLELLPKIYQTLAAQSRSPQNTATVAPLILQTYLTTARILSGRTHRWKRDPHLSQSTRISAAGSTGMKLTTLDRTHTIKEDQDALEAISSWSRYAHAFNSTLLRAKSHRPTAVNLSNSMPVRTVNGPGVLLAKEVCAVCGLKRNERVVGVDVGIEDVFGEYWIEFWGHRDCCAFWDGAEGLLERR